MKRHDTAIGTNSVQSTFLRGGQIFFHNARMYWQLISRLFMVCIFLTTTIAVLITFSITESSDARLFGSRMMARYYTSTGRGDREMNVIDRDNEIHHFEARDVVDNEYVVYHSDTFQRVLLRCLTIAGLSGILALLFMFWWFTSHGRKLGSDQHLRGAQVIPGKELALRIHADNRVMKRKRKLKTYRPYSLVGIEYPFRMETSHTLLAGTTGSGKTQAMATLIEEVRRRGDRAIFYDKMRSFLPVFYDEDAGDRILNPLDSRCARWTPFSDARTYEDFLQMATAMMPDPAGSADPFWVDSARVVFAVAAAKLHRMGRRSTDDLLYILLRAPLKQLAAFLQGTIASASVSPDSPKTAQSVRATLVTGLAALQSMEKAAPDRDPFSIYDWVKNHDDRSCLFLTSRSDKHQSLRGLITVWLEMALNAIMSQERDPDRTIWIFADELPSLNKLPSLEKGLAEGRQFGAAYVLGIQTLSQLQSIYGRDVAHTITGLCRTKLILNLADPDTAETAARYIGRAEIQRAQRGIGFGASDVRDGVNYTLQDKFDHLVLPEQLQRLPDLTGYLVPAATYPTGEVTFAYRKLEGRTPGFIERDNDFDDIDWHAMSGAETPPDKPSSPSTSAFQSPSGPLSDTPVDSAFAQRASAELGLFAALEDDATGVPEDDLPDDPSSDDGGLDGPAREEAPGYEEIGAGQSTDHPDFTADPEADGLEQDETAAGSFTQFDNTLSGFDAPGLEIEDR